MGSHTLFTALIVAALGLSQLDSCLAIQCYNCTSTDNGENCLKNPASFSTVDCTNDCFTSAEPGNITRGCLSGDANCSGFNCNSCNSDKCNTNLVCQQCLGQAECGSSNVTDTKYNVVCGSTDQVCVNQVNENQTVTRQCGSACATDAKPDTCSSCNTALCNEGMYPTTRLQCYSCTGETCNTPAITSLTACELVSAQCYMTGTSATAMQRGCTSDAGAKCQVGSTDTSCVICNTTSCNNLAYERDAGTCIECTNCAAEQNTTIAKSCGKLTYNQEDLGCYTLNNGTVTRGCLTAEQGACTTENSCKKCSEANCNVAAEAVEFQCAMCSTLTDAKCQAGVDAPLTACTSNNCFYGYWNGAGIRGCFDQASELMQYQCVNEKSHECVQCTTSLCNKVPFSGADTLKKLSVGLLVGLVLALRYTLN
ncbi:G surface protein, allelic form 168 [Drosophila pseudoobscura]|uniref:G surface protein, allelic form 168 n=1 Tax=Drosophila pseudoobscura pseudoobscura TaxID=46245 RepID=A0A6I8UKB7_DROPS|nr:G surface protein, allelic form 168 [Drosophila pseudoobscura]